MNYIARQDKLISHIKEKSLDALLVKQKHNIMYLTGTRGEDSVLFVSPRKIALVTDARYEEEYKKLSQNFLLCIDRQKNLFGAIAEMCQSHRVKRIGFEAVSLTYSDYRYLKNLLKEKKLIPTKDAVEHLRMIKDGDEITCIKKACVLGSEIMNRAIQLARPGLKERDVRDGIEFYIRSQGTAKADFDIIVASGANSSMPHAPVSDRRIKRNEMVLIDLGGIYNGYNSDLTRTICVGKITPKFLKLYAIVHDAQKRAIEAIKPGIQAKTIDNISHQYISQKGMGRYFVHSLGHGIGLQTHEKPSISRNTEARLEKGMVITVEPGIYIHRWGGIRIEDDILVIDSGSEILTERAYYVSCR